MNYAQFVQLAEEDKEKVVNLFGKLVESAEQKGGTAFDDVVNEVKSVLATLEGAEKTDTAEKPAEPGDTSGVQTSSDLT